LEEAPWKRRRGGMPTGPFASAVGVGRADPEWAALNLVTGVCGRGAHRSRSARPSFRVTDLPISHIRNTPPDHPSPALSFIQMPSTRAATTRRARFRSATTS